jgi:stage V sporulation protein R
MGILPLDLEHERVKIEKIAADYGLDFFHTIFEMVTYDQMNQLAAFGGFPVRYPHWKFGMEYESLSKGYEYGLSKIYEMVINTDPCYAYLMEGNLKVDQKLVMAHVYGHCDFFKNNYWFSKTDRKMMDTMANHATRIRRYVDRYGIDVVEEFIDTVLCLENLIDRNSPFVERSQNNELEALRSEGVRLKNERDYMESYINPPEFIAEQKAKLQREREEAQRFPPSPEQDIMKFLLYFAPLTPWQQDIVSILRDEAYYFSPQGQTKTMNEGWASYWHTTMMTQDILTDAEVITYADHHSGTVAMAPNGYNPYKVGIELFRDIEERWNKGQFGREWDECDDYEERRNWNRDTRLGREKIFEVRKYYNDVTFIDEFLTEDFCVRNKLFVWGFNQKTQQFEINTRDFPAIKAKLLFHMTNFGQPIIKVADANFENRGELLLAHTHEGIDLQPDYIEPVMRSMQKIWSRPVNLATVMDNVKQLYRFDGNEFKSFPIEGPSQGVEEPNDTSGTP